MATLEALIFRFVSESPSKLTYTSLARRFRDTHGVSAKMIRHTLAAMISSGELCYTSMFGRSFIEVSFDRPRKVSEHIVLTPPHRSVDLSDGCRLIRLERGASFGAGEHPTTRLSIQLIDKCLHTPSLLKKGRLLQGLDIGTGSGVLALVAATLGVERVVGFDIDPCSIHEARENVRLNHLIDRVIIRHGEPAASTEKFDLVLANLRPPTLIRLGEVVSQKAQEQSVLIFSGMKTEETPSVEKCYQDAGFKRVEKRSEKGWSAICLMRGLL